MFERIRNYIFKIILLQKDKISNYSFGAVSAVITSLALIISFDVNNNAKLGVVGSLLVIALADNISDTLGIHVYQEGEYASFRKVWKLTLTNFLARIFVILFFILFVLFLSPTFAIFFSVVYGYTILIVISYVVAKKRNLSSEKIIIEHLVIATCVLGLSKYLTVAIKSIF
jgi:vacuolar iron transporter family protein